MANMEKKEKLYNAIKDFLPSEIAMALAESSGAGSEDEIRFLVGLVCEFKSIAFHSYGNGRNGVNISAKYAEDDFYKDYSLRFSFQHKVKNAAPKSQDWRVDVAVFVYANYPIEGQVIGGVAFEYDGHPLHYVESKIKSQMVRDVHILEKEGLQVRRVSPEGVKSDPGLYKKTIRKCLRRCIDTHKITVDATIRKHLATSPATDQGYSAENQRTLANNIYRLIDCPACKTQRDSTLISCDLCKGHGSVLKSETRRGGAFNLFTVPCLACCTGTAITNCRHCGGSRTMDNVKALNYAKNHIKFGRRRSFF